MSVTPERKNPRVLARRFKDELQGRTGVDSFRDGSKAGALVDVFVDQLLSEHDQSVSAFRNRQIQTADIEGLRRIGESLGRPQFGERFAQASTEERVLALYVSSGTFGDLEPGGFSVPAGTRVWSPANSNELQARIGYHLTSPVQCAAGSSIAFGSIRAEHAGAVGNVDVGVLTSHDYTGIAAANQLLVTNLHPILNGKNEEKIERYRYRLARHYDALVSSNDARLHLEALRVPGVTDTRILTGYYGIGTVAVVVLGASNQTSSAVLRGVQARLGQIQGAGHAVAIPAVAVSFDFVLEFSPSRTLSAQEKGRFERQVRVALAAYLSSVGIGGSFDRSSLIAEVNARVQVSGFKRDDSIFKHIYIRRAEATRSSTERERLISQALSLESDEFAQLGTLEVSYR